MCSVCAMYMCIISECNVEKIVKQKPKILQSKMWFGFFWNIVYMVVALRQTVLWCLFWPCEVAGTGHCSVRRCVPQKITCSRPRSGAMPRSHLAVFEAPPGQEHDSRTPKSVQPSCGTAHNQFRVLRLWCFRIRCGLICCAESTLTACSVVVHCAQWCH